MAIKFPDSDGFGNPGTPELSFENDIALEFTTDSASYSEYGDADHVAYTQTKRPFSLSQYFRNGNEVPDADANGNIPLIDDFPTAISFSDFYGAVNEITIEFIGQEYEINGTTYTANMNDTLNLFTIAELAAGSSPGNNITVPFVFKFDSDTVFNNSIQFGGTFSDITIENNGIIAGRGGHGLPLSSEAPTKINYGNGVTTHTGNAAIWIDSDQAKVEIINLEKGFIAGGGNGANAPVSADEGDAAEEYDYNSNPSEYIKVSASGVSGGPGGWNGGIGGKGSASVFARAYETNDDGSRDFDGRNYGPSSSNASTDNVGTPTPIYVNIRSSTGTTGHTGLFTSSIQAEANRTAPSISAITVPSGGTGLNGGNYGKSRGKIRYDFSNLMGCASKARCVSGSGGGSGIGSDTAPYNVNSAGRGSSAGAGYSVEIKSGSIISESSFTNNGRRYGDTDITIS